MQNLNLMGNARSHLEGFDEEMNRQFAQEKSRTVKICMLKYKCIFMIVGLLMTFAQAMYIAYLTLIADEKAIDLLVQIRDVIKAENVSLSLPND